MVHSHSFIPVASYRTQATYGTGVPFVFVFALAWGHSREQPLSSSVVLGFLDNITWRINPQWNATKKSPKIKHYSL